MDENSMVRAEGRERLRPYVEKARGSTGWNLDEVAPNLLGPGLPWDYRRRAAELIGHAMFALDMGTGAGERFAEVCEGYRGRAVATEAWHVNAPIAKKRLFPLGVEVVHAHSLHLPLRNEWFDLVLNRHEELDPGEVSRVVVPGGRLLTQQVGRNEWKELRPFFPRMQDFGPLFESYVSGFRDAGMTIVRSDTCDTRVAYRGLGELVYILCLGPWTIPGFDPLGRDLDALLELERRLTTEDGLVVTESRFVIEARKPRLSRPTSPPHRARRFAARGSPGSRPRS